MKIEGYTLLPAMLIKNDLRLETTYLIIDAVFLKLKVAINIPR